MTCGKRVLKYRNLPAVTYVKQPQKQQLTMLSPKQKKALFGASIESRPRYVRVPLQMVNSVRELNTDVNFARLVAQFEQTDDRLRSSTTEPIAHIRLDASGVRGWADFYDRYCSAYRALNGSRIIRRMRVTGYRMINISCRSTGYDVVTDSYVRGIDEACVDGTGRNFLCAFWHFLEVSCPSIETRGNDASSHRSTMYIVRVRMPVTLRMDGHGWTVTEAMHLLPFEKKSRTIHRFIRNLAAD